MPGEINREKVTEMLELHKSTMQLKAALDETADDEKMQTSDAVAQSALVLKTSIDAYIGLQKAYPAEYNEVKKILDRERKLIKEKVTTPLATAVVPAASPTESVFVMTM